MNSDKEKLLNETYEKFIRVSMNKLPPEIFDDIAAEDITGFGTAIDEKILSISDSRDLIDRQMEQLTGMELNYEIIPCHRRISPEEDSVLIVDEIKISIKSSADTHKLFIRNSTIMEFIGGNWKAVHFHSSKPDDTKGESDTWYINEWKRKNEELQNLVNEKTTELVIKNRDLEIEASLERVRAIAMGMRRSDDLLDICETLFDELRILGFDELRNTMINIHNDEEKTFVNYDYSDTLGRTITPLYYNINPVIAKQIKQIRKGRDAFSETYFKGDDLKEWKKFRKRKGEPDDPRLKNTKALYYYFYSIGTGSIGISTFESVTKEQLELLKRFRNVFEFAYRRYMDVMQAEEQTREARIEAALERVRSRTMAMQKSDELSETTFMLFQQFMDLGEAPDQITIGIINKEEKVIEFWTTMEGNQVDQMVKFPIKETNLMSKLHAAWKKQKKSLALDIKGKELHDYIDYRIRLTGIKTKTDHVYEHRFIQAAFFSKGMITISTNEPRSKETLQLLERFAGVFDLTYTRFLDLKQAEAQTKEAQIELSLERVRARSMAMHRSDELVDASIVLFNELKSLGIDSIRTGVGIFDESKKAVEIWSSQLIKKERNKILGIVPFKSHPFFELNYKAWKRKEPYFFYEIAGKDVKKYYKVMSSVLSYQEKKDFNQKEIFHTFFFPEGSLNVVSKNNLTEDECSLMVRFAKVFGMIYRRFLDLQKAEVQTREAQIELALERVRARTMAMQKSNELEETSQLLFQQFKELGEHPDRFSIGIIKEDERHIELWVTVEGDKNRMVKVPIDEPIVARKLYTGWKEQRNSMLIELTGKELKDYIAFRKSFGNTHGNSDSVKDRMISYVAFFSRGIISITPNGYLPKETIQLLERFAGVFDLTYTRFLDLQKAEEQAREAQVEVALERVRSRTMAMHKSDELAETAAVLFQQLCVLGINALRLYIGIIEDESGEIDFWTTDYGGSQVSSKYKASLFGSATFKKIYNGWKEKQKSIIVDPKGKELTEHLYYLKEIMNYPIRDRKTLSRRLQTIAYFSKGLIGVLTNDELPDESINLLERFAGVFDLTYRRFLDLQKAEAQTREAQIEVALERVRSRTMAMHSSNELQNAAVLLFQQIRELSVDTGSCGYIIWENENKDSNVWMSSAEGGIQDPFKLTHTKSKIYKEIYSAKEEGKDLFVKKVKGAELRKHFDYLTSVPGIGEKIKLLRNSHYKFPETIVYNIAFFKQGYLSFHTHELSPEAHDIFRRFANVFEQTYTRFLDLQKAEAQAREAQIQLALERVRAKAMAMQKSDELLGVSLELYDQFKNLDSTVRGLTINIVNEKERVFEVSFGMFNKSFKLSIDEPIVMNKAYKCWKSGKKSLVLELDRKELLKFNKIRNTAVGSEIFPLEYKSGFKLIMYMAFFSNGMLIVGMDEYRSEETIDILQRFASVFDLTYTRFLDLKKAEAQTREAQIEASLEKIRSRSLAMHNAEELGEVISVVVEKLKELDFSVDDGVALITHIEGSKDLLEWMANPGFPSAIKFYLPYFEHPVLSNLWKAKNKGAEFVATRYTAKENRSFLNHIFIHSDFKHTPQPIKDYCLAADTYATSIAFQKNTAIFINDYSGKTLSLQEIDILKRFSKVFEQAYIRFLDLQKAEAQAKEAYIEAALERVRSRTMGMQKSEELKEVIQVVYEQFVNLNINIEHTGFDLDYKTRDDHYIWIADNLGTPSQVTIPYFDCVYYNLFKEAKEKGMDFFAVNLTFKEKNSFYQKLFKYVPGVTEESKEFLLNCPGLAASTVLLENVALYIENFSGISYTDEENATLMRFGKVFQQTYTRFLDLQKAEAQAREGQIELGLERVRARAMAMQNSIELEELIGTVFTELTKLDLALTRCIIWVFEPATNAARWWMANSEEPSNPMSFFIKYHEHPAYLSFVKEWKRQNVKFVYDLNGEDKTAWDDILFNETELKMLPEAVKDGMRAPGRVLLSGSFNNFGGINTASLEPLSDEHFDILLRFAKVFDLTYTRFNDLQKAEGQAREAKIETSLERVRSKTMAMHNSPEVGETVAVMFDELRKLGIETYRCGIGILDETKEMEVWAAKPDDKGKAELIIGYLDMRMHPLLKGALDNWKNKKESYYYHLKGKDLINYFNAINKHVNYPAKYNFDSLPQEIFHHDFYFKEGTLFVFTLNQLTEEDESTFKRFAGVFGQTYRRYLDLQKAEAQAREAQIEAALERTRTQSMLMQHSSELDITSRVFHEQLLILGIGSEISFVWLPDVEKGKHLFWTTWIDTEKDSKELKSKSVTYDLDRSEPYTAECFRAWESGEPVHVYKVAPGEVKTYFDTWGELFNDAKRFPEYFPEGLYYAEAFMKYGCFGFIISRQLSEDEKKILLRFTNEFERTYSRFLDLQKSEEQTREAQIQLALERVRARAMAMQKSDELSELVDTVFKELTKLDFALTWCIINIIDEDSMSNTVWAANPDINKAPESYHMLFEDYPFHHAMMKGWKERKAKCVYTLEGTEKEIYDDYLFSETEFKRTPEAAQATSRAMEKYVVSFTFSNFGGLQTVGDEPLSDTNLDILSRFGKVFDLTYTRFNDLKQTEAQAREAQIEAAMERVRGKAMAMHNSDDLTEAAGQVFSELNNLGIKPIRSGFVLLTKDNRLAKLYPATSFDNKNTVSFTGEFEFKGHPVYEMQYESWQKKENYFPVMEGDLLKSYYKILAEGLSVPYVNFPTDKKQFGTFLPFSEGFLFTWSDEKYSENEINILDRFKNILDLTIRRYIDLKNAEAQSRESQIEASLERVRSKAMAMQKSDDLSLTVATIFEELEKLDLGIMRCGIGIIDKLKKSVDVWATTISDGEMIVHLSGDESMDTHPLLQGAYDAWLKQEDFSYLLQGDDLKKYYEVQILSNFKLPDSQSVQYEAEGLKQYYYVATFQSGGLFGFRDSEFSDEAKIVIKRFADVINFTYTRFYDLKQAEAQAKEAKIEAALERVRAGSLIMRKPEDMFDVCKVISEQLNLLNVIEIRNTQTVILNESKETYQNYEYFPDYNEKTFSEIDYNLHPKVKEFVYEIRKSSEAFFTTSFEGKKLQEWREYRKNTDQIPDAKLDAANSVHYYFYSIGPGALGISTYAPLCEDQISIFKRFRNVFELAYRRYVDIEQAEAQARESQIEAALERVRSRTLAMQKSDELAETAAVVFRQLINLGIDPNRLYIGIINDDSGDIEAWATDEDGTRVSREFTLNINANASVKKMFNGWVEKKRSIIIDMQGEELKAYLHYISDVLHVPFKGGLSQDRRFQNIAYFSKGFIGMASPDQQPEETAILLERFAAVFNLTFTRFNDLQIAEKHAEQAELDLIKLQTEKMRAEEALSELRATQAQLIQSEKMASLGELTAGIAHEIQNPLNFVNNFSEVNTELIDELNEELGKGNFEDAVLIAKDIKENEEKIKHHGKRAEGIVKGMLQHSRSSIGVKEPTNLNALADEYLRLAYHGLRAKDKSFNAKMETNFDESIGEINVVPQDIGRVILNLITNAFYAVTEKKKDEIKDYEPKVTVSTARSGENVLISIKDNGNGIQQKVMEKIFQPFFTTKPTGQGTGLGLSMSYDIIKAHGGELKVDTKEGEGAEFVIILKLN